MAENEIFEDFDNENGKEEQNRKRKFIIIIAIIMIFGGLLSYGAYLYTQYEAAKTGENVSVVTETTEVTSAGKVKNPIDFNELQSKNKEVYAWIKVPGTKVDYPVVQSETDDNFYLKHDALTKRWVASGAVYSEMGNTTGFNDRVTVLYGHNGYSDTMFTTLHKFEDKDFFDKHEYFYIYTPKSKLTYRIVSAFKYDDRHILNSFDFQDNDIFRGFLTNIQSPPSTNKQSREIEGGLDINNRVVVLSTCITHQKSNRYLVCGVLEKNEETY